MDTGQLSGGFGRYVSDFDETTYGIAYRPMVTLQPRIDVRQSDGILY